MIQVDRLAIQFDSQNIFEDVSFLVPREGSAVIVGPSGSGKSVLLKIIAGLISPTAGSVRLETQNYGMLFQKNALFDSFTVEENLLFPLKERLKVTGSEALSRSERLLKAVGLYESRYLLPDEISGGMQKRLGIARALIVEPEVILYDEPTAGLDPITSRVIADLILDLKRERRSTLLTVTNDMQRAYQLGETIYLLAQGRLTRGGTPDETRNTSDPALAQFIRGSRKGPLTEAFT